MVAAAKQHDFQEFFGVIDDPRMERRKAHELIDILFLCVAGTLAGCEGPAISRILLGRRCPGVAGLYP